MARNLDSRCVLVHFDLHYCVLVPGHFISAGAKTRFESSIQKL